MPLEFYRYIWYKKTRVPGLSQGVIFRDSALNRFNRIGLPACDGQPQDHSTYSASIASYRLKTMNVFCADEKANQVVIVIYFTVREFNHRV